MSSALQEALARWAEEQGQAKAPAPKPKARPEPEPEREPEAHAAHPAVVEIPAEAWRVDEGDCVGLLRGLPAESIDAIVTDPPYGLGFMGKKWDELPPGVEWAEACLRVLKPGGHLLAFGGTRTYHRLACAIEDADFEIRDTIAWMYGSGFPKSHNLNGDWNGWGTALKPAHEPIVVARKPPAGTVAANVLEYGVGALNIDRCRVGAEGGTRSESRGEQQGVTHAKGAPAGDYDAPVPGLGRWPANVVLDEEAARLLDEQTTDLKGAVSFSRRGGNGAMFDPGDQELQPGYGDSGGASRFFYCAKASRSERNAGLEGFEEREAQPGSFSAFKDATWRNHHPTVKPVALMRYLVRLVTSPGGLVLDPFTGSGTTGIASVLEGFRFLGFEREGEYADIARARIARWEKEAE